MGAEFTQKELDVYNLKQSGMSFRAIAEKYGVSTSRASQMYHQAQRKIREKERAYLADLRNQRRIPVVFTIEQLLVIQKALYDLIYERRDAACYHSNECNLLVKEDRYYQDANILVQEIDKLWKRANTSFWTSRIDAASLEGYTTAEMLEMRNILLVFKKYLQVCTTLEFVWCKIGFLSLKFDSVHPTELLHSCIVASAKEMCYTIIQNIALDCLNCPQKQNLSFSGCSPEEKASISKALAPFLKQLPEYKYLEDRLYVD